jgi:hypothetical protein
VVNTISPEKPLLTTAVTTVALTLLKETAALPPNVTLLVVLKPVPVMVTVAFSPALVGVNDVIVGTGAPIAVKPDKFAVPPKVVTETLPDKVF